MRNVSLHNFNSESLVLSQLSITKSSGCTVIFILNNLSIIIGLGSQPFGSEKKKQKNKNQKLFQLFPKSFNWMKSTNRFARKRGYILNTEQERGFENEVLIGKEQ